MRGLLLLLLLLPLLVLGLQVRCGRASGGAGAPYRFCRRAPAALSPRQEERKTAEALPVFDAQRSHEALAAGETRPDPEPGTGDGFFRGEYARSEQGRSLRRGQCFRMDAKRGVLLPAPPAPPAGPGQGAASEPEDLPEVACLPDLMIPGVQKGGTTALHALLGASPCFRTDPKLGSAGETHFFDFQDHGEGTMYGRVRGRYLSHFRVPHDDMLREGFMPTMYDKTPRYLSVGLSSMLAARIVPDALSLIALREPTERMYSHFHMLCGARSARWRLETVQLDMNAKVYTPEQGATQPPGTTTVVTRLCDTQRGNMMVPCLRNGHPALIGPHRKVQCTAETFHTMLPALVRIARFFELHPFSSLPTTWKPFEQDILIKQGLEANLVMRSQYAEHVSQWAATFPKNQTMIIFLGDFRDRISAVWPLAMWYLGFEGDNAPPLPKLPKTITRTPQHAPRTIGDTLAMAAAAAATAASAQSDQTAEHVVRAQSHGGLQESTHRQLNDLVCNSTQALAKMLRPAPLPHWWACTGEQPLDAAKHHEGVVAHIPVSREMITALPAELQSHLSHGERTRGGEWRVYRADFTANRHPGIVNRTHEPRQQQASVLVARYFPHIN